MRMKSHNACKGLKQRLVCSKCSINVSNLFFLQEIEVLKGSIICSRLHSKISDGVWILARQLECRVWSLHLFHRIGGTRRGIGLWLC